MKYKIMFTLLAVGELLLLKYDETMSGVVFLAVALGIISIMAIKYNYMIAQEEIEDRAEELADEMFENAEYHVEYESYIGLGKGYDD